MRELLARTFKRWWFWSVEVVLGVLGVLQLAMNFDIPGWVWPLLLAAPLVAAQFLTALDVARERDGARRVLDDRAARREIRTRLEELRAEADNVLRGVLGARHAYRTGAPSFSVDWDATARWQGQVRRYLSETQELGEEYVHRFDELIVNEPAPRPIIPEQLDDHIFRLREMKRRLEVFRQEFA